MSRKQPWPVPKVENSQVPPHPRPQDPQHGEWLIDEGSDESFPASDPSSVTQPHTPAGGEDHGTGGRREG